LAEPSSEQEAILPKKTTDVHDRLSRLLGELEREVAEWAWQQPPGELTVRQALEAIKLNRHAPIAYTTVMTVMSHLADKGLFTRRLEGKTYYYRVVRTKEEFIARSAARQVERLVESFGDLALAQFADQLASANPELLARLAAELERRGEEEGRVALPN
jgi:predicted transcriptional regulator